MSKVLLVDTGFSSAPIYQRLCSLGHEVHVVGGNPTDALAKAVSNFWNIDYSDISALQHLLDKERFDFIVPGCTDKSYDSCVAVSHGRFPGLDSSDVNNVINNKALFRDIGKKLNLPMPKLYENIRTSHQRPLVVKPVDSFSGKGITIVENEEDASLSNAILEAISASKKKEFLLEEYVKGLLYSHSAFIVGGKIQNEFIVQEYCIINRFAVDTSFLVKKLPQKIHQNLRDAIESLALNLRIQDGLIHTQFIANNENLWLIEATRRCPGDLYSQLIELTTGFPYIDNYIRPFLGMPSPLNVTTSFHNHILRHTLTVPTEQRLYNLHFKRPIEIERWIPLSLVGDHLNPGPYSRIGILFARAHEAIEFDSLLHATLDRELYQVSI